MTEQSRGYVLTEIWNARPSWLALSKAERTRYFEEKIYPFLASMVADGAEILACATNDNDGPERIDYTYMAVWRLPDRKFSEKLVEGAKALGFLDYFDQVNFSGNIIPPPALNNHMIHLPVA